MSIFGFIEQNMELPHVDLAVLCFLEMKQKYFNGLLPDPEDKVFGAFVLGKYPKLFFVQQEPILIQKLFCTNE